MITKHKIRDNIIIKQLYNKNYTDIYHIMYNRSKKNLILTSSESNIKLLHIKLKSQLYNLLIKKIKKIYIMSIFMI